MKGDWRSRGRAHVFGDDLEHDGAMMPRRLVAARVTEAAELMPHLFEEHRPGFAADVAPGDFVVGGRNFGCGHLHNQAFIAMEALGLRILCVSMPGAVVRATVALALPCLHDCPGVSGWIHDGDDIEAAFDTGEVTNLTTGEQRRYQPLQEGVRIMLQQGGMRGLLTSHLAAHPELAEPR